MVNSSQIVRTYDSSCIQERPRDWRDSKFIGWYKYHGQGEVIPAQLDFTTGKIGKYDIPDINFDEYLEPLGNDSISRLSYLGNAARNKEMIAAALIDNRFILAMFPTYYKLLDWEKGFMEIRRGDYNPGYTEYKPVGYIRTLHLFPEGEIAPYALLYDGESILLPSQRWRKITDMPDSDYDSSLYDVLLNDPSLSAVYKHQNKIIRI